MLSKQKPAVGAALAGLIDYAGLFPPAGLPMRDAHAEYAASRRLPQAWMLGRFVVPLSRLGELAACVSQEAVPVSAILDAQTQPLRWFAAAVELLEGSAGARSDRHTPVTAIEAPLPALTSAREAYGSSIGQLAALLARNGLERLPTYVEFPRDERWQAALPEAMASLARHGLRAKVRCGGPNAAAFPNCQELAAFILAAARARVPFRATAGLHHPIRHFDPTVGAPMHGFLNLLAATLLAVRDDDPVRVEHALAQEDAAAFAFDDDGFWFGGERFDIAALTYAREAAFVAYGSCSFTEPIDDLTALGILRDAVVR